MTCMLLLCCMLYVRVKWKGPAWISHVHPWCFSGATLASWNSAPPTEAVEATTRPVCYVKFGSINPHPFGSIPFFLSPKWGIQAWAVCNADCHVCRAGRSRITSPWKIVVGVHESVHIPQQSVQDRLFQQQHANFGLPLFN